MEVENVKVENRTRSLISFCKTLSKLPRRPYSRRNVYNGARNTVRWQLYRTSNMCRGQSGKGVSRSWPHLLGHMAKHLTEISISVFFTNSEAWYTDPSSFRRSVLGPEVPWENIRVKANQSAKYSVLALCSSQCSTF